ncbi:MAG: LysR family transcriptional regulator [Verrucomicrobia bacterium]|nr:MAG: LysR family transcriptional regulator [Verrucomicrobiota bacterium]
MELRVLRYFLAVASEGSVTGASNLLHVSQPALSKQIIMLEEELGCKLFVRRSHSVSLTEEGMLLRKRAEEILEMAARARSELSRSAGEIRGEIYIGGGETRGMRLVAKVVRELRREYPGVCCNIFSGNADDVMERMDKGLLDFGLIIQPADLSKYDSITLPDRDRWGVIMRKDSPLAAKKSIRRADLFGVPLILSRQIVRHTSSNGGLAEWFGAELGKFNFAATYNLIYNASVMAAEGVGYAVGLDGLADTGPNSEICFRPLAPKLESGMSLAWKKGRLFSKPAEAFLSRLRKYCGS